MFTPYLFFFLINFITIITSNRITNLNMDKQGTTKNQDIFNQFLSIPPENLSNPVESSLTWVDPILQSPLIQNQKEIVKNHPNFVQPIRSNLNTSNGKNVKLLKPNNSTSNLPSKSTVSPISSISSTSPSDSIKSQSLPNLNVSKTSISEFNISLKSTRPSVDPLSDNEDLNVIEHSSSPTIPVDSPSMHMFTNSTDDNNHNINDTNFINVNKTDNNNQINNSNKPATFLTGKFQHQFMIQNPISNENNLNFGNVKPIKPSLSSLKKNISFNLSTSKNSTTSSSNLNEKVKTLTLLKNGLEDYCSILIDETYSELIKNRSEYLIDYLKKFGLDLKARYINELLGEIKKNQLDNNVQSLLQDANFSERVKYLLNESEKRRKWYNKRRNVEQTKKYSPQQSSIKSTPSATSSTTPILTGAIPTPRTQPVLKLLPKYIEPKVEKLNSVQINQIRIGSFINQQIDLNDNPKLVTLADLANIQKRGEDERYISKMRSSNSSLKSCIEDIYGTNLLFTHSLAYTKVPINPNPMINIDLENDQIISYVEVLIDFAQNILPTSRNASTSMNFASILQLKSLTRIYYDDQLVYRRCDPITGAFTKDNKNSAKIILPLQAKIWAGLINNYHNGIINDSKFNSLRITHTLYPNDDIIKFRTGANALYSFVWEFFTNNGGKHLPQCVNIVKRLDAPISPIPPARSKSDAYIKTVGTQQSQQTQQQMTMQRPIQKQVVVNQSLRKAVTQSNFPILSSSKIQSPLPSNQDINYNFNVNNGNNRNSSNISRFTVNHHNIPETPMSTSTPLTVPSTTNSRGHKRTRSRSMNEIDLMTLPLGFDGIMNMSYLESFSPTDSIISPVVKQNVPYLKSQHISDSQRTNQQNLSQQQKIQNSEIHNSANYNGNIINNFTNEIRQMEPIFEFKHFNNSDSQLELGNFQSTFDESTVNSLMGNQEINTTNTSITKTLSPKSLALPMEKFHHSIIKPEVGTDNNATTSWSKLPTAEDFSMYSSNVVSAPPIQTTFEFDENSKEITEFTSSFSGIPGINTP